MPGFTAPYTFSKLVQYNEVFGLLGCSSDTLGGLSGSLLGNNCKELPSSNSLYPYGVIFCRVPNNKSSS